MAELRDDVIAGEFSLKEGSEELTMLSNSAIASFHRPLCPNKKKIRQKKKKKKKCVKEVKGCTTFDRSSEST